MTQPNDGGPAFPRTSNLPYTKSQEGMRLRDWLAGQALAGLNLSRLENSYIWQRFSDDVPNPNGVSELCYMIADAMLKARSGDE